jgi:hypothetical protein
MITQAGGGVVVMNSGPGATVNLFNTILSRNGSNDCLLKGSVGVKSSDSFYPDLSATENKRKMGVHPCEKGWGPGTHRSNKRRRRRSAGVKTAADRSTTSA